MHELSRLLADLPLGGLRYYERIGSTNEAASEWAAQGAPNLALVIADEQTAGRGRSGRRWFTSPGAGLAFSVILRPEFILEENTEAETASQNSLPATSKGKFRRSYTQPPAPSIQSILRLTALGALAVSDALRDHYQLATHIKWPNDILVDGRKLAGVLVEAQWQGEELLSAVLGIGINVASSSVPNAEDLLFPATCVEAVLGQPVERWDLLHAVIQALVSWYPRLNSPDFLQSWEQQLAYRGEWVRISAQQEVSGTDGLESHTEGVLSGLNQDGFLRLKTSSGEIILVQFGEVHLRPMTPA